MKKPPVHRSDIPLSIICDQWLEVLEELNIGAFTVGLDHRIMAINHCAQALMGLRADEVLGRDCREIFSGVPCMVSCLLGGGEDTTEANGVNMVNEEDNVYQITRMATPIYTAGHQVAGCLTILQDHSPISDLIDRLRYEERSLKMILDSLDIGVFTINCGGLITFFNTAAESVSGYERGQVLGQPCNALFESATAGEVCLLKEVVAEGSSCSGHRGLLIDKYGDRIPIRASYMALRDEKNKVVGGLATFQDMTLVQQLKQEIQKQYTFKDMIGKSPRMQKIFHMIPVVAASNATVLIEGATGTGKDLLAKIIHAGSPRTARPLVKINCAAIPESLLESEFFGYVKGAFTGAVGDKPGRFQEADGGTIFLDEIGDLPLAMQAKLLRVLEDKEFYPLGARRTQKVDVRILSATNRDLNLLVKSRQFREDLFYRLNVVRIELPPLAQRRDDLPLLIHHTLRKLCAARALPPAAISPGAMQVLLNYDFPGNVRELENILEHALILRPAGPLQPEDLPEYLTAAKTPTGFTDDKGPAASPNDESRRIAAALAQFDGHCGKTAQALGIHRTTLWRKMKRYGLNS